MNPLELRQLGTTSLKVTALGLGGATLGDIQAAIPESQADATVEAAFESGVTYFDTAPWYGIGKSEHRMGHVLRTKPRDTFVLSTKVGRVLKPLSAGAANPHPMWPHGLSFEARFDYTGPAVVRSHEDSLARLGVSRVDALLIHDLDLGHHGDEAGVAARFAELESGGGFAALKSLRNGGQIAAIGAGINVTGFIPRFLDRFDMDFFIVAMPYTLLNQDALEEFELCRARGVGVVIGAPFASGLLAGGSTYGYRAANAAVVERAARIRAICDRHDVPLGAAALQFVLAHPVVASVIPGPNSPEQFQANLAWLQHPIPAALWDDLRSEGLIRREAPTPSD